MSNLNTLTVTGNLTCDSEIKYTAGGMAILTFSLAVNRSVKDGSGWKNEASFFDCKVFGKLAEWRAGLAKGAAVLVSGEIRQERWEKDGQNHSKVVIIAEMIEQLAPRKANDKPEAINKPEASEGKRHAYEFADDIPF